MRVSCLSWVFAAHCGSPCTRCDVSFATDRESVSGHTLPQDNQFSGETVTAEHMIRRYAAFFRGWAQAFGEHRALGDATGGMRWLIGDDQVGLIVQPVLKRLLYPLFLHRPGLTEPAVTLGPAGIDIGTTRIPLAAEGPTPVPQILELITRPGPLHLYQTYHLIYPPGTRILTLSARAPLGILYRELAPLRLGIDLQASDT